jgi:CheY-like chemotaxis protein
LHEDLEKFVQLNRLGVKMPLIDDRKKRIVIIDDDKLWLELQHKNITRNFSNTEVYCFQDGYQAILEVGKLQPDLIILDLVMPYFDGFRFMDALQKIEDIKQPLLLVISAFLDDEKVKRLKSSIASRWLSKTVFKEEFLENIAKLLGKELVERVEAQSEVTAAAV